MAKRIDVLVATGLAVEACPHGNTYPTGKITITETATACGDLVVYSNSSVDDDFHVDGLADIYVGGVFQNTIICNHDKVLGKEW